MPDALRSAGYSCELHDDHFPQNTEDTVWLATVAARKWVVLTKDERIRYRPLELQALKFARVRVFILISGNVRGAETAAILLKAMPKILETISGQAGPFIYFVYKDSTLRRASFRRPR